MPSLRHTLNEFLEKRVTAKLDTLAKEAKKKGWDDQAIEEKRQQIVDRHERETWLAKQAERAKGLSLATHAPKFMHPGAKDCTSVYLNLSAEEAEARADYVGTHSLTSITEDSIVAASGLSVHALLKLTHEGKTILQMAVAKDPILIEAMSDDPNLATQWCAAFANVCATPADRQEEPRTSALAKQVYFPLPDGTYHLLAPLHPTSLMHQIYTHIWDTKTSEDLKAARKARRDNTPHDTGYHTYTDLALQYHGGSKPQNVSQLNLERGGATYLFASLPPTWSPVTTPPLKVHTVFGRMFGARRPVYRITKSLTEFLVKVRRYNNWDIRKTRAVLVDRLVEHLIQFAAEIHELKPGWSDAPECQLSLCEALWLDPYNPDPAFRLAFKESGWVDDVAERFAAWFNDQLRYHSRMTKELEVDEVEEREWEKLVRKAIENHMEVSI